MKNGQSEARAMLVLRSSRQLALAVGLAAPMLLLGSCRGTEKRLQAPRVSVAEIERTYGRVFAVAKDPTPEQQGTGDSIGLLRD